MTRNVEYLEQQTKQIRRLIIRSIGEAGSRHPGDSLFCADLIAALYFDVINIRPEEPLWEDRDRFVLSKGHACPALYVALAMKGYYPIEELDHLWELGSILQGHSYSGKTPGVGVSTGSLGQGLSVANDIALDARLDGKDYYVYCLMGDGETGEGQVWEAAMSTVHCRLDHVIAFVDYNHLQIDDIIEEVMGNVNVTGRFEAFGWNVLTIDGHKIKETLQAIDSAKEAKGIPTMIVMNTVKGKGVSFMENQVGWHGSAPSVDQVTQALKELGE